MDPTVRKRQPSSMEVSNAQANGNGPWVKDTWGKRPKKEIWIDPSSSIWKRSFIYLLAFYRINSDLSQNLVKASMSYSIWK
jgi:hypothetical protein